MMTIGSYEAKTHLPGLLDRVAKGESIMITKHGVPVAILTPVNTVSRSERRKAIRNIRVFRQGKYAGGSLKAMIVEGRR